MRIPLDYYRILGVTSQATGEEVSQAYQDRRLQLPRREYGNCAITARQQLLEQAYQVLSGADKRSRYDQQLSGEAALPVTLPPLETGGIAKSASDGEIAGLEISESQLPGVLLIFQELGDYQTVIRLGEQYLPRFSSATARPARTDITLSLALAYRSTSLEHWQQGDCEKAAVAASQGRSVLQREQLFPEIEAELAAELDKLRPYRILERVALSSDHSVEREQGLELLREMLDQRQGIDGRADDGSGLGIDDFLRFVQQLRLYLTAEEQQQLFESEAVRPSKAAIYLAAYVLLARGFAEKQPRLLLRAQEWLERLEERQDVYLERAACALLLGQTAAANSILEQVPTEEALLLIRQHSQDSPDLIPGLCWYAERWLQTEVLTHFRDLASQQVSLEEYFADESVQAYLENLLGNKQAAESAMDINTNWEESAMIAKKRLEDMSLRGTNRREKRQKSALSRPKYAKVPVLAGAAAVGAQTVPSPTEAEFSKLQDYAEELPAAETAGENALPELSPTKPPRRPRPKARKHPHRLRDAPPATGQRRSKRRWSVDLRRLLPAITLLLGLGSLAVWLLKSQFNSSPPPVLEGEQLQVSLDHPPIEIPSPTERLSPPSSLSAAEAKTVLETWLDKKSQAFGKQHQVAALNEILAEPQLSIWRKRAETLKNNQSYRQYQHQIEVESAKSVAPGQAVVEAKVKETTDFYQGDKLNRKSNESLRVRYNLSYQGDRWLIQNINVLP